MRVVAGLVAISAVLALCACGPKAAIPAGQELSLASLPAPYNGADLVNGKLKFLACKSCHTVAAGAPNLTGPNLHGIFGRTAGTLDGYKYSDAVKTAGFVWDAQKLDHWLQKPKDFLPGTKMTFPGYQEEKDRVDLIGYLAIESTRP